jgi:two-component system cell cycle response regulator DivK
MDIKLPRMSGIEAIRALKAAPETRSIPIVAVSSYALPGDDQKATQAGADGYLSKPVQLKELLAQVRTLTARPRREA